ncbi:hypothetical protein S40293_11409 [Stachybotrys chartarum IBT 40293]|nr:hypothetical protein S40293_11409 [Stachybotrys chartarum IBT 40293]
MPHSHSQAQDAAMVHGAWCMVPVSSPSIGPPWWIDGWTEEVMYHGSGQSMSQHPPNPPAAHQPVPSERRQHLPAAAAVHVTYPVIAGGLLATDMVPCRAAKGAPASGMRGRPEMPYRLVVQQPESSTSPAM